MSANGFSRRRFLGSFAAMAASVTIVPRHVLGGEGQIAPSDTFGGALIGCGGRGPGTFSDGLQRGGVQGSVKKLADCDVKFLDRADNKTIYSDFRRVLERKDIDLVAIATPPHWHALISIAAMQAGKDVVCEKPMTRFIAEGKAVIEAEQRYGRVFQIGTYGRMGASHDHNAILVRKIMTSGLLKECKGVYIHKGGWKVKEWSGKVNAPPQPIPKNLDWEMYCGPSPWRPYQPHRHGGTHRGYWDYEGGGLSDMGQHYFEGVNWKYGKDLTSPVEIESYAAPAHPEAVGMWGWVELKFEDGMTFVFNSTEWGKPYDRLQARDVALSDLSEEDQKKVQAMPDPEPLIEFQQAVKTRRPSNGSALTAHRTACLLHLANVSIRVGRKIRFDPVKQEAVGDEEANRLINQPMRAPWHL
ncbi:MAG: Gfo/Idh/MocA family oxidoreductase [Planctomycetota bacterium]